MEDLPVGQEHSGEQVEVLIDSVAECLERKT
jgi:hypothetical protein